LTDAIGGGGAASKAADFGATAANLTAFNTALTTSTATLSGHAAVTTTSAAATTLMRRHKTIDTGVTSAHAAAATADTTGFLAHAGSMLTDTAGFIAHAAQVIWDTAVEAAQAVGGLFGFEGGGIIPSAAGGMLTSGLGGRGVDGRGGRLGVLHPREMVLPSHLSQGVQNMINSGNGGASNSNSATLNYSPTINAGGRGGAASDISSILSSNAGSMIGQARNLVRRGWRP